MATRGHQIIAGYDGSAGSAEALDWAVGEARLRAVPLTVWHAWTPAYGPDEGQTSAPAPADTGAPGRAGAKDGAGTLASAPDAAPAATRTRAGTGQPDPARVRAERVLADGVQRAAAAAGPAGVRTLLTRGPPARALCELSADADLIAVGSRGRGGLTGLLLGSVSLQVAAHAQAPVTVVRGHWRPVPGRSPAPVVAGADGSPDSLAALELAATEAALRDVPLVAVCALCDSAGVLGIARGVEAEFAAAVDRVQAAHPAVAVHRRIEPGTPRSALLAAAAHGQLLVVGARGRGGLAEMVLGSVGLALLQHATCPVTVVHRR